MTRGMIERLTGSVSSNGAIRPRLVSIIWIGSRSHGLDIHDDSDVDVQIVMDRPDYDATIALAGILENYPTVDLSLLYKKDVWDARGNLAFQDGTKGGFFIPVLAAGKIMFGEDFYASVFPMLTHRDIGRSLLFTIREYLARLRVMAAQGETCGFDFKKYSLKLLKDVCVYQGWLTVGAMPTTSNRIVLDVLVDNWEVPAPVRALLRDLVDYRQPFNTFEKATLLLELERLHEKIDAPNVKIEA